MTKITKIIKKSRFYDQRSVIPTQYELSKNGNFSLRSLSREIHERANVVGPQGP